MSVAWDMSGLGLVGYGSSGSESDDEEAFHRSPQAAAPEPAGAAARVVTTESTGFSIFGVKRGRVRARKGGLPLFNQPVANVDNSDSEDEVCISNHCAAI